MEALINDLSDPTIWTGVSGKSISHDDYLIDGRPASMFEMSAGSEITAPFDFDLTPFKFVSMVVRSTYQHGAWGKENYLFYLNDVEYRVPISHGFNRVLFPITNDLENLDGITIKAEFKGSDKLIISHLIAFSPELPSDILRGFKRGIEDEILNRGDKFPIGQVSCKKGDLSIIMEEEWEWLEKNIVIMLGDHSYQVGSRADNRVTFLTTYDGETILEDFNGTAYAFIPVEIGFYDREIALPGVALWYNSPRPVERHNLAEFSVMSMIDGMMVQQRSGATMTWRITLEIAARSPQLVQSAARCVRAYLGRSVVWVNNVKLWWIWNNPAADSEPVADYDIVPRANYFVEVEIREEVWALEDVYETKTRNIKAIGVNHG